MIRQKSFMIINNRYRMKIKRILIIKYNEKGFERFYSD